LAWDLGFRIITLESDSKLTLDLILDNDTTYRPHAIVLGRIRTFVSRDWSFLSNHTLREGNECEDWLAKHGAQLDVSLKLWVSPPL